MGASQCEACLDTPVMKCGRCTTTRCEQHVLGQHERCDRCELDWGDEAPTRYAAKLIFAPPVAIFSGGLLFGVLMPVSLIGVAVIAMVALAAAVGAGAGACRVVDRSARALFLRERAGGLPPARLLPSRSGR
ncbi:MAG: hypothetical protein M4D80_03360 [Myxococcota bacterium]|nr:hypothetical protein [Deltaproteobacteria bacterium]MDQ3334173.1 hypothetical protein [Myxococcota bacterium]